MWIGASLSIKRSWVFWRQASLYMCKYQFDHLGAVRCWATHFPSGESFPAVQLDHLAKWHVQWQVCRQARASFLPCVWENNISKIKALLIFSFSGLRSSSPRGYRNYCWSCKTISFMKKPWTSAAMESGKMKIKQSATWSQSQQNSFLMSQEAKTKKYLLCC